LANGLVPVLLRTSYGRSAVEKTCPVVFSIHTWGYTAIHEDVLERVDFRRAFFSLNGMEFFGKVNFEGWIGVCD